MGINSWCEAIVRLSSLAFAEGPEYPSREEVLALADKIATEKDLDDAARVRFREFAVDHHAFLIRLSQVIDSMSTAVYEYISEEQWDEELEMRQQIIEKFAGTSAEQELLDGWNQAPSFLQARMITLLAKFSIQGPGIDTDSKLTEAGRLALDKYAATLTPAKIANLKYEFGVLEVNNTFTVNEEEWRTLCAAAETTRAESIVRTPGVCGGSARIAGTRIPVWTLYVLWRAGASDGQVLATYPSLSASQLRAAHDYVERNYDEIARDVREQETANEIDEILKKKGDN